MAAENALNPSHAPSLLEAGPSLTSDGKQLQLHDAKLFGEMSMALLRHTPTDSRVVSLT